MNGIKMSDCNFYVDEDARVVICVIPNTKTMVHDYINEHFRFPNLDFSYIISGRLYEELIMPKSFMGKAVCAEGDDFNVETGKLIAFTRAKDRCYKSFFKRANLFVQTVDRRLNEMIDEFNDFGMKLEAKHSALLEAIEKKVGLE